MNTLRAMTLGLGLLVASPLAAQDSATPPSEPAPSPEAAPAGSTDESEGTTEAKPAAPAQPAQPAVSTGSAAAADPPRTAAQRDYPLAELLEKSASNAAVIAEHEARMRHAEWQQYRARWAWAPKLRSDTTVAPVPAEADPDAFGQNLDEIAALNLGPMVREKVGVVIPLYTFNRIGIAQELAKLGVDVSKLQRQSAARDVEFEVTRAFYARQLSTAYEGLLSEASKIIKDKLADMEEAREFGEADFEVKDLRKLQIFDAELDGRILDNRKLGLLAADGLRYFSGVEGPVPVGVLDEEEDLPPIADPDHYLTVARKNRSEVQMLSAAVEARELQHRLAKANFYPNVFAAAEFGVGWSTETVALRPVCRELSADSECVDTTDLFARPSSDPLNFLSFGIALGVRWDFDFWQLRGGLGEAEARNDEVAAQQRRALGAIEVEIRKLVTDAAQAHEKVAITARRLGAARRWRDQFGLSLETGGADLQDAVDPLKAYYEARALHLQARFDYHVARAALAKGVGLPVLPQSD